MSSENDMVKSTEDMVLGSTAKENEMIQTAIKDAMAGGSGAAAVAPAVVAADTMANTPKSLADTAAPFTGGKSKKRRSSLKGGRRKAANKTKKSKKSKKGGKK
jgi:hypothetical protein